MKNKRKKELKFFVSFGILVLVAFCLIGCGNNNYSTSENAAMATTDELSISTENQSSPSEEVEKDPMHEWSDSRICSRLPEANFREVKVSYDNEDYSFFFFAYGVSREDYEAYIEACKEKGFIDDVSNGDFWFTASNADGYYVSLNYVADEESMTCLIKIEE